VRTTKALAAKLIQEASPGLAGLQLYEIDVSERPGARTLVTTGVRLLVIALPAYFAWEMLQAPAFTGMPSGWWAATVVCALAAAGDGVIVLAVFGIGAGLYRDWRWFAPSRPGRFAIVVLTGVIVHVAIEWVMVHRLGRWGYQPWHPIVPLLGIGVVPLLQPLGVLPLVFWALARTEPRGRAPAAHERR